MTSQGCFPTVSVQIWKMQPAFLTTECVLLCTLGKRALVKGRARGSKADPQLLIFWFLRDIHFSTGNVLDFPELCRAGISQDLAACFKVTQGGRVMVWPHPDLVCRV